MRRTKFTDRDKAGRALAKELGQYADRDDVVVVALPRGGVPVGYPVARRLGAPLDVMVVRKLGVPGHEELAMGAVATGEVIVRNDEVIRGYGIADETIDRVAERERKEVHVRERRFRGDRETAASLEGKVVIVVDDGIATGSTMRAALGAIREQDPQKIVMAVPVAPSESCARMRRLADEVHCLFTPRPFMSVGTWYRAFPQVPDREVRRLLDDAAAARAGS